MDSAEFVRGELTSLLEGLPEGEAANDVWVDAILEKYSEPHRYYHTLTHLEAMLRCLQASKRHIHDPTSLSLAILFHDIVYNPQERNNEILSIDMFERFAMDKCLPAEQTSKVSLFIERTITHTLPEEAGEEGNSSDLHFFLDSDLEVLSRPSDAYRAYASQIRKEYSHVPINDYRAGRIAVLQKFLARERIYFSQEFHAECEAAARRNLQQEIHDLTDS
ncbi:uncharacterized protein EV420DRAFT_1503520 [Desarmillaria tabescens]|uniref:HD domain-containing protein n=1 Tax=Armillaria tabescens TaxID=1929756 RepID=A0AA39T6N6_ARMTA|nr:uncharacterized protein EV420DRAFT_1503520 [Desarmillaria tabescens]KAK0468251.1 hypothetical protein EV420DRAFT_1503520 [Desarmillaria tabescens]